MSNRKTIFVRTDETGAYTWERNFQAEILAIEVQVGDLSTPDIDITDDTYSQTFLSVNGVAADTVYYPSTLLDASTGSDLEVDTGVKSGGHAVCMGVLKVEVTGGGDTKKGRIVVLYQ
jgi:hypothetical protein